jgi:uncharacterized low-complexity protein
MIALLAVVVGIALLVLLALAAARQHPRRTQSANGGDGSDIAWMSGIGTDSGSSGDGDCGADGGSADGGGCGGGE